MRQHTVTPPGPYSLNSVLFMHMVCVMKLHKWACVALIIVMLNNNFLYMYIFLGKMPNLKFSFLALVKQTVDILREVQLLLLEKII